MSNEPHVIEYDRLVELLVGLGVDPDMNTLLSVLVEPHTVTVTRNRVNGGSAYLVGEKPDERLATETVTIRIQR